MEHLPDIFAASDGYCDVTNAFAFTRRAIFILIDASSDRQDRQGSALIRVDLSGSSASYEVLHEFGSGSHDYHAGSPEMHYILASGGYIHRIQGGELRLFDYASEAFLNNLAPVQPGVLAVFGEEGTFYRFDDGDYELVGTDTDEDLASAHFLKPDLGYVCGTYGTLLRWNGRSFSALDIGGSERLNAVRVCEDGQILLAASKGVGLVVRDDEILRLEGPDADLLSVAEFRGQELWGDDDHGIYVREGSVLVPRYATGYAFDMNVSNDLMTINAGYDVYLTDGTDWIRVKINPSVDRLVEIQPLDFDPT